VKVHITVKEDDCGNGDQCVGGMAAPSPVLTATPEPNPSTTYFAQNQRECQLNERSVLVPEQRRNIWRTTPFRLEELMPEDVRTDITAAKGVVL
jgi:hypothetical protein